MTIILIHGWCGDRTIWREQTGISWSAAAKVLAIDLPGHGVAASNDNEKNASIASFASHVVSVVNETTSDPVVLVGHSMGGPVALEAAIALGRRCRLLVGVDTFTDSRFYASRPPGEIRLRLAAFDADFEGTLRSMIEHIVAPRVSREIRGEITASMMRMPKATALAALRSLLLYDIEARWPKLRAPAITINSSLLTDPATQLHLPDLVVHAMADVGHFPMIEAPQAFNEILAAVIGHGTVIPQPSRADPL
ncbi:alpha/beta fold hydrolase [Jiella mangrovi]|uniref:Alpha/beta hydrolase n=1 Tax=Jiella mangrovi TaxID=2821407 RepID=A0ABS4BEE5_9HYPH|nr:alpha/beta hydrolase [Jiella mangrovi]MBP0615091.1 alpha/beta hydrolase [Jiella mangrovi]